MKLGINPDDPEFNDITAFGRLNPKSVDPFILHTIPVNTRYRENVRRFWNQEKEQQHPRPQVISTPQTTWRTRDCPKCEAINVHLDSDPEVKCRLCHHLMLVVVANL